jgi:hypothetical protein
MKVAVHFSEEETILVSAAVIFFLGDGVISSEALTFLFFVGDTIGPGGIGIGSSLSLSVSSITMMDLLASPLASSSSSSLPMASANPVAYVSEYKAIIFVGCADHVRYWWIFT